MGRFHEVWKQSKNVYILVGACVAVAMLFKTPFYQLLIFLFMFLILTVTYCVLKILDIRDEKNEKRNQRNI